MSIALTQKVKELESIVKGLVARLEALEKGYTADSQTSNEEPPRRRGRRPKHEDE